MQRKQRLAIGIFVGIEVQRRGATLDGVIDATLKASRKKPDDLYKYIRSKGYRWSTKYQRWSQ